MSIKDKKERAHGHKKEWGDCGGWGRVDGAKVKREMVLGPRLLPTRKKSEPP